MTPKSANNSKTPSWQRSLAERRTSNHQSPNPSKTTKVGVKARTKKQKSQNKTQDKRNHNDNAAAPRQLDNSSLKVKDKGA